MTAPTTDEVLDNPVLHALAGAHAGLAERRGRVARYAADVAPFGALPPDPVEADWLDLAALAGPPVALLDPGELPAGWSVARRLDLVQMVLERTLDAPASPAMDELGAADVPAMLNLTARTQPGPFLRRTVELGRYVGVHDEGALVAMAGERMRPPGWTEISAVCTAPSHRGQGLARRLVAEVSAGIQARGEGVFLHVLATNASAIGLYESMGFAARRAASVIAARP